MSGHSLRWQKEVLIMAVVVQALPTYVMSVFKIPFGLCDTMQKHARTFWWGSDRGKRRVQWIPWNVLIKPKSYGGLGFKDLRLFDQALLAHQAMRLITYPQSLCAQVLKRKYFPQSDLLDMAPAAEASVTWRAIEYGVELLKHGAIKRIGDGESTRIWRDNWIPRTPNMKPSDSIRVCRLRRVSQLMRPNSNEWDEGKLRRFFQPWDVDEILKVRLPLNKAPDWVAWQYEKTGIFTARSAYRLALTRSLDLDSMGSSASASGERGVWKKLWQLPVPPKVRNFVWKLTKNGLPTNANRCYRHIADEASCGMCYETREESYHAVMECPHARALRDAVRETWCMPAEDRLRNEGLTVLDSVPKEEAGHLAMVLWRAWTVRNKVTRAGETLSIDDSVMYLTTLGKSLKELNGTSGSSGSPKDAPLSGTERWPGTREALWLPPDRAVMKINVGGAVNPSTGEAAVGAIMRDYEGQPHAMVWRRIGRCRDAEEAEALALMEGLRLADQRPVNAPLVLESDSANLIQKVQSKGLDKSAIAAVIMDIKQKMEPRHQCSVHKIWREQNKIAHNLARFALKARTSQVSFSVVPPCIQDLVLMDRIRCGSSGNIT
jgi:ribonuclease HI